MTKDTQNTRIVTPTTVPQGTDHEVESDLRNALTAEKVNYVDTMTYSAASATMRMIEPELDWGHQLQVKVGDARIPGDRNVVCLSELSASGVQFAIGDVASGPHAGTFYGRHGCPTPLTAITVSKLASQGFVSAG